VFGKDGWWVTHFAGRKVEIIVKYTVCVYSRLVVVLQGIARYSFLPQVEINQCHTWLRQVYFTKTDWWHYISTVSLLLSAHMLFLVYFVCSATMWQYASGFLNLSKNRYCSPSLLFAETRRQSRTTHVIHQQVIDVYCTLHVSKDYIGSEVRFLPFLCRCHYFPSAAFRCRFILRKIRHHPHSCHPLYAAHPCMTPFWIWFSFLFRQ